MELPEASPSRDRNRKAKGPGPHESDPFFLCRLQSSLKANAKRNRKQARSSRTKWVRVACHRGIDPDIPYLGIEFRIAVFTEGLPICAYTNVQATLIARRMSNCSRHLNLEKEVVF